MSDATVPDLAGAIESASRDRVSLTLPAVEWYHVVRGFSIALHGTLDGAIDGFCPQELRQRAAVVHGDVSWGWSVRWSIKDADEPVTTPLPEDLLILAVAGMEVVALRADAQGRTTAADQIRSVADKVADQAGFERPT